MLAHGGAPYSLSATPEGGGAPVELWTGSGQWDVPTMNKAMAEKLIEWARTGTPPSS